MASTEPNPEKPDKEKSPGDDSLILMRKPPSDVLNIVLADTKEGTDFINSFAINYVVGVLAACNAELFTYPLDLTKTRLQIQGELANKLDSKITAAPYRGTIKTAFGIAKEEGVLSLWQGITPMFVRHSIYSGCRIIFYQNIREKLFAVENTQQLSLWKSAFCGVTAGALAQYLASPADLIKVQMQMEGKRKLMGEPPRVTGFFDAFGKIWRAGGIWGLWKGAVPNMQRAALVNLGDLTTYDVVKRLLLHKTTLKDGAAVHIVSSLAAGFVAAVMGTPADVIKTRVMNQATDDKGRPLVYKSSVDCFIKTAKNEGFTGLYKGFVPCWIRLGPWALIFWVSFENIKIFIGGTLF